VDAGDERIANALVAVVGGTRPAVSPAQVLHYLTSFYQVAEHQVVVCRSAPDDFILLFLDRVVADKVLLSDLPMGSPFVLLFQRWHWQSCALFSPLRFKVLLAIDNVPAHA
jgi:hypothetical protein